LERQAIAKPQNANRANHPQRQSGGSSTAAHPLINLQSLVGNQATQRLLPYIQARLQISTPGDPLENEADHVADTVVARMAEPGADNKQTSTAQTQLVQRRTPAVAVREDDEEEMARASEADNDSEEERDKTVAMMPARDTPVQMRAKEDDELEDTAETAPPIQRQTDEEEEPLMLKSESGQIQASSDLQQRLASSKGSGQPLPKDTRSSFESALGADFSSVQIHTGTDAVELNKDLGAHAFTHGSDIYFNAGKYDPSSASGKHLLAHELTHTVQQGGALRRKEQSETGAQFSTTGGPAIQAAWYNFSIPFTDYEFDPSWEGVKTAAGVATDTAVEGATWVKDRVVEGVEWVFDKIKALIESGIEWLTNKFDEIKEFATSCFDTIKNTVNIAVSLITNPMKTITGAFANLDADALSSAWSMLTAGAQTAWRTIKAVIDGVLEIGSGIWSTVSGFVTSLFDRVGSLLDSSAFSLLPDFLQDGARTLYNSIRFLWESIRDFWDDLWKRLTSFVKELITSIESFVERVLGYAIDVVVTTVKKIKEIYDFVVLLFTDPQAIVQPLIDHIAGKIQSEAPGKARDFAKQKMVEALASGSSSASPAAVIQRAPAGKPLRTTASHDEVDAALDRVFAEQISAVFKNLGTMLWETFVNVVWPPATIREIGKQAYELVFTDWANALDSLFLPRDMFEDFGGFLHDVWTNILILLDFPLALLRRLVNVLMLLMVYITLLLMIIGAVGGAIAGNVPGAIAGGLAGLKLGWALGELLFASFVVIEAGSALKAFLDLFTARQTDREKERDYLQIVGSSLGIGIAIVLALLFMILGSIASRIAAFIKGKALPPAPKPPKQLGAGEGPKSEPKVEPPKEEPKVEPPKEEPKVEPPKEEPKVEPPKEEPKVEPPKEEPKVEPPKEEPKVEPPKEEPKTEPPEVERPKKPKKPKEPKEPPGPKKDLKDLTIEELVKEADKKQRPKETAEQRDARVKDAKAEAQRRGYCFVKGTYIQTPDGPRQIETLLVGEMVLARGEDESVQTYAITDCLRSSTSTLYHLEIGGTLKLSTTRHHPFFVPGKGWIKAKDLLAGDKLLSLDGEIVFVTNVVRERLTEPVTTFNFHVSEVHSYFVGNGLAVLVHNGTPVNDPVLNGKLLWGLGSSGPRQRLPDPAKGFKGDLDGASAFVTNSTDDVGRMLGASSTERTGNHGAITEAQLKSEGLVAVKTPGEGAIAEAGFEHVSIRPESNPNPSNPLTPAEMAEVKAKLENLDTVATNKPADFLC
jgi:hypothetical protein